MAEQVVVIDLCDGPHEERAGYNVKDLFPPISLPLGADGGTEYLEHADAADDQDDKDHRPIVVANGEVGGHGWEAGGLRLLKRLFGRGTAALCLRRACLSKYAFITSRSSWPASGPWPAPSQRAAITIWGSSLGANATNQALV